MAMRPGYSRENEVPTMPEMYCVTDGCKGCYAGYEANQWCTTDGGCFAREQITPVLAIGATCIDADGWKLVPGGCITTLKEMAQID